MIENPPMKKPIIVRGILVNNPRKPSKCVVYIYEDDTCSKEEAKSHTSVTDDMENGSNQTIIVIIHTHHHIAYLCNDKIS